MRQLEKIIVNGTQYLLWNATAGKRPAAAAIRLLLDGKAGVGAHHLLVVDTRRGTIRFFDAAGQECTPDAAALYTAALWLSREGQAARAAALLDAIPAVARERLSDQTVRHIEIRLTDTFGRRLLRIASPAKIAG